MTEIRSGCCLIYFGLSFQGQNNFTLMFCTILILQFIIRTIEVFTTRAGSFENPDSMSQEKLSQPIVCSSSSSRKSASLRRSSILRCSTSCRRRSSCSRRSASLRCSSCRQSSSCLRPYAPARVTAFGKAQYMPCQITKREIKKMRFTYLYASIHDCPSWTVQLLPSAGKGAPCSYSVRSSPEHPMSTLVQYIYADKPANNS